MIPALLLLFPAHAGVTDELPALRAARMLDQHVMCEFNDADACAAVAGRSADEDRQVACAGIARLMVGRTGLGHAFSTMDGDQLLMVDGSKFLANSCEDHAPMLDGLAERVDATNLWSVIGYAEAAQAVTSAQSEACKAWAQAVTTWPAEPEDDLFFRVRLGKVADCGDHQTIRTLYGDRLESSATGLTFLGQALAAAGEKAQACTAFTQAAAIDPTARAGNSHDSAERGVRSTCGG